MRRIAGAALGATGLVVLVAGTFLPWLSSGHDRRNSYQTGGALQRLLGLQGILDSAVSAWPFVGLLCAGVIAIFAAGLRRCAALLALLTALAAGAVALTALRVDGNRFAGPVTLGPTVTLVGAIFVLAAATLVLASSRVARSSQRSES